MQVLSSDFLFLFAFGCKGKRFVAKMQQKDMFFYVKHVKRKFSFGQKLSDVCENNILSQFDIIILEE